MHIDSILHPTDFSDTADHARGVAVDLATRYGAALHLFHGVVLHAYRPTEAALEGAAAAATAAAARLVAQDSTRRSPEVQVSHLNGVSAFDAIMERATQLEPDLIVMGTHGRKGVGRLLIGSTAEKVVRHAPGNVVTVRSAAHPRDPGAPSRVLVPVDFSDGSARALDAARWLARPIDTRIHLLHVIEPIPPLYYGANLDREPDENDELRLRMQRSLREWSGDIEGAIWTVTEGPAPGEIARVARNTGADLVVLGTRGLTGLPHMLIGSVTERVCRSCESPVLVVRSTA